MPTIPATLGQQSRSQDAATRSPTQASTQLLLLLLLTRPKTRQQRASATRCGYQLSTGETRHLNATTAGLDALRRMLATTNSRQLTRSQDTATSSLVSAQAFKLPTLPDG